MSTDFRALCAELLVLAEESISYRARVNEAIELVDRARFALAEHVAEPLSPAAQAILAPWCDAHGWENEDIPPAVFHGLAAALRALADAVVPEEPGPTGMRRSVEQFSYQEHRRAMRQETRADILAIATELENHD